MANHSYHPMCGCAQCCETERALELDDEMRDQYQDNLVECPSFVAELALENEEAVSIAIAMKSNNLREIGMALVNALYRAADELIVTRAEESSITPGKAAKHLYEAYRPDVVGTQTRNEPTPRLAINRRARMSSDPIEVLRELRDTGDVSDWRAMESALDAAIAALSDPAEVQPVDQIFAEWLASEMPAGTVIGDPAWWAGRIARQFAKRNLPPSAPVGADESNLMARLDAIHRQVFGKPYPAPVRVEGILAEMREEGQADLVDGGIVLEWEDDLRNALAQQPQPINDNAVADNESAPVNDKNEWVLVPREPTQAMLDAGHWPCVQGRGAKSVWATMLAATPLSREYGSVQEMFNPSAPVGAAEDMVLDAIERRGSSASVGVEAPADEFNGDTPRLIRCIESLLRLDAAGALVPHGVGGHARTMLAAAAKRLAQQPAAMDEAMVERIAALLYEEATDEPWAVAGIEHDGPDRDYYRTLAHKVIVRAGQQTTAPTWIGIDWAEGQKPEAVDDRDAWREAFIAERATRYREGGMAIEQARIHAETDAACIDADALASCHGGEP